MRSCPRLLSLAVCMVQHLPISYIFAKPGKGRGPLLHPREQLQLLHPCQQLPLQSNVASYFVGLGAVARHKDHTLAMCFDSCQSKQHATVSCVLAADAVGHSAFLGRLDSSTPAASIIPGISTRLCSSRTALHSLAQSRQLAGAWQACTQLTSIACVGVHHHQAGHGGASRQQHLL